MRERSASRSRMSTSEQNPSPDRFRHSRPIRSPRSSTTARRRRPSASMRRCTTGRGASGAIVRPASRPTETAGAESGRSRWRSPRSTTLTSLRPSLIRAACTWSSLNSSRTQPIVTVSGHTFGLMIIASATTPWMGRGRGHCGRRRDMSTSRTVRRAADGISTDARAMRSRERISWQARTARPPSATLDLHDATCQRHLKTDPLAVPEF
jgi:hypothetical protein